jgi:hypothetical protein
MWLTCRAGSEQNSSPARIWRWQGNRQSRVHGFDFRNDFKLTSLRIRGRQRSGASRLRRRQAANYKLEMILVVVDEAMKPRVQRLFMKWLTRNRVVPTMSARASWLTGGLRFALPRWHRISVQNRSQAVENFGGCSIQNTIVKSRYAAFAQLRSRHPLTPALSRATMTAPALTAARAGAVTLFAIGRYEPRAHDPDDDAQT